MWGDWDVGSNTSVVVRGPLVKFLLEKRARFTNSSSCFWLPCPSCEMSVWHSVLKPISCTPGRHYRDLSDMNSATIIELFLNILNILEKSIIFLTHVSRGFCRLVKHSLGKKKSRILRIELLCKISWSNRDFGSGIQIFFSPATILLSLPCQYSGGVLCAIKTRLQPSLFL